MRKNRLLNLLTEGQKSTLMTKNRLFLDKMKSFPQFFSNLSIKYYYPRLVKTLFMPPNAQIRAFGILREERQDHLARGFTIYIKKLLPFRAAVFNIY
jgi:hypothetical protein